MMTRGYGLEIPGTVEELCHPSRMALLVYDMQVGILRQIGDARRVLDQVADVLEAARSGGFRIVFTRHMSLPNEVTGVSQLRRAMAWQHVDAVDQVQPPFLRDSPQFQLVPELAPRPTEVIFDKISMSAFVGTPLDIVLRDCGLVGFAVVGVAMEVGIEPTVRHAADLGYLPVVVTDSCGAGSQEAAERSLAGLAFAGDSLQTDVATLRGLMARAAT